MNDVGEDIAALVAECRQKGRTVGIAGQRSKSFLGDIGGDERVDTTALNGIVDYRPEELVLTALAGTPLQDVSQAVAAEGQLLPFDPPGFGGRGTFGGAIACAFSGPARPWRGSVRDCVLGVELVNGLGERLRFGGSVMKNVAGYDVSRLAAGSRGTLGVILSASVRLLPAPEVERTFVRACDASAGGSLVRRWARAPLPITATCQLHGALHVRLSGSASSVASAAESMALREEADAALWPALRDHRHPFFESNAGGLVRLMLPRGCAFEDDDALIEWGGAQAWLRGDAAAAERPAGAVAERFRGAPGADEAAREQSSLAKYAGRLKAAFDPDGVLNPRVVLHPHAD